jgi:hypothetical protein
MECRCHLVYSTFRVTPILGRYFLNCETTNFSFVDLNIIFVDCFQMVLRSCLESCLYVGLLAHAIVWREFELNYHLPIQKVSKEYSVRFFGGR